MTGAPRPLKRRFYAKVLVDPSRPDGCWRWASTTNGNGYGVMSLGRRGEGREYAHRLSWQLFKGEALPEEVDHICRNRSCVNPEHLRAATSAQNKQNYALLASNKTGYRGVSYNRRDGVYYAQVEHQGVKRHLGSFRTAEEAAEVA